jgi:hypothetical protein
VHWLALRLAMVLFSERRSMDVLFAERTSDGENHETSAVIIKCRNAGISEKD